MVHASTVLHPAVHASTVLQAAVQQQQGRPDRLLAAATIWGVVWGWFDAVHPPLVPYSCWGYVGACDSVSLRTMSLIHTLSLICVHAMSHALQH